MRGHQIDSSSYLVQPSRETEPTIIRRPAICLSAPASTDERCEVSVVLTFVDATTTALLLEWRDRVARYERRSETSAEFCRREPESVASLFFWRRRLATETAVAESVAAPSWQATTPTFLPE